VTRPAGSGDRLRKRSRGWPRRRRGCLPFHRGNKLSNSAIPNVPSGCFPKAFQGEVLTDSQGIMPAVAEDANTAPTLRPLDPNSDSDYDNRDKNHPSAKFSR
jgi:hypothetical protein